MLPFDFSKGSAAFRARGVALATSAALLALPCPCLAAGPSAALHVTRSEGASDCPDVGALGADVAHSVGHDAFDADPSATPGSTVNVLFSHGASGYAADITTSDGRAQGAQRIMDASATCATLAHAVVATLAVLLDGIVAEPTTETTRPTETTQRPSAPVDPDDIPPRDPIETGGPPTDKRGHIRWYGWQILIADFASFGTLFAAAEGNGAASTALGGASFLGLFANGAVFHGLHRRTGAAIGSVALRLALPLVGGAIGGAMTPTCTAPPTGPNETLGSAIAGPISTAVCQVVRTDSIALGAVVGWLAASVVDVSALSWDHASAPRTSSGFAPTLSITPFVTLIPESDRRMAGTLGVAGSF